MILNLILIFAILGIGVYLNKNGLISRRKSDKDLQKFVTELEQKKAIERFQNNALSFEDRVQDLILSNLPGSRVIRNVHLYNGRYIKEIPMIILSTKGFFVVESINYPACKMSGKNNEKSWICTFPDGNKFSVTNPVYKLNSHIWNLKKVLKDVHFNTLILSSENKLYNLDHFYMLSGFMSMLERLSESEDVYNDNYIAQVSDMIESINQK